MRKSYQEERRNELIDGKIVTISPVSINHAFVSGNLYRIFANYLYKKDSTPIGSGMDLYLDDNNRFVPDFMVVRDPEKLKPNGVHGTPDLVVEVLSPLTVRNDKTKKKDTYSRCGVREYWLVSPEEKSIEIYRTNGTELILHDIYALHPDWQLAQMTDEERAAVVTHFQCSLFDDLDIPLADIFYRTF